MSPGRPKPAPLESADWDGPYIRYDLVKEFVVALVVITALVVILAILFSSPDDKPVTIQQWARTDPGDFVATAVTELDGSSEVATYGPPYNHTPGAGQKIGPAQPAERRRGPLPDQHLPRTSCSTRCAASRGTPPSQQALNAYEAAPPAQKNGLDRRLHEGSRRRQASPAGSPSCRPATTDRSRR